MDFSFDKASDDSLKDVKPVGLEISMISFGRKKKTHIKGLDHKNLEIDITIAKGHLKSLKNKFKCNGGVDKETFEIHLFGDHRENVKKYFIDSNLVSDSQIAMSGVE